MRLGKILILLFLITLIGHSCDTNQESDTGSLPQYADVAIRIEPSIEQSEMPIDTRAAQTNGIYALNIKWRGKTLTNFQPYASGLFTDVSQIKIRLITGYEYIFDCTFLDYNDLPHSMERNDSTFYGKPFAISGGEYACVTNKLLVSTPPYSNKSPYYEYIYKGTTQLDENRILDRPSLRRYYGQSKIDLRNSIASSHSISIDLMRAYYQLQFRAEDIAINDTIAVTIEGTRRFTLVGTGQENSMIESDLRLMSMWQIDNSGAIRSDESVTVTAQYYSQQTKRWTSLFQTNPTISLKRNKINKISLINILIPNSDTNITTSEGEMNGLPTDEENQTI